MQLEHIDLHVLNVGGKMGSRCFKCGGYYTNSQIRFVFPTTDVNLCIKCHEGMDRKLRQAMYKEHKKTLRALKRWLKTNG